MRKYVALIAALAFVFVGASQEKWPESGGGGGGGTGVPGLSGDQANDEAIAFMATMTTVLGDFQTLVDDGWTVEFYSADAGGMLPEGSDANPCTQLLPCQDAETMETSLNGHNVIVVVDNDSWVTATAGEEMEGFDGFQLSDVGCGSGGQDAMTDDPCAIMVSIHAYLGIRDYARPRFDCTNTPAVDGETGGEFVTVDGSGSGYFLFIGVESYRCPLEPTGASTNSWATNNNSGRGNLVTVNVGSLDVGGIHTHPFRNAQGNMVLLNTTAQVRNNQDWDSDCVGGQCSSNLCSAAGVPYSSCVADGLDFRFRSLQHPMEFGNGRAIVIGGASQWDGLNMGNVNGNGPACLVSDAGSGSGGGVGRNTILRWDCIPPSGAVAFNDLSNALIIGASLNQDNSDTVIGDQYWRIGHSRFFAAPTLIANVSSRVFTASNNSDLTDGDTAAFDLFQNTVTGYQQVYYTTGQFANDTIQFEDDASIIETLTPISGNTRLLEVFAANAGLINFFLGPRMVYDTDEGTVTFDCRNANYNTAQLLVAAADGQGWDCSLAASDDIFVNTDFLGATASADGPGESGTVGTDGLAWNDDNIDLTPRLDCVGSSHECGGLKGSTTKTWTLDSNIFVPSFVSGSVVRTFKLGTHSTNAGAPPRSPAGSEL